MRRIPTIAALLYAALAVVFAFTWDHSHLYEDESLGAELYWCAAFLIQPLAGFLLPRLWALGLPFVPLAVVLPWSEPNREYFGVTDAGMMFFGGFFAMILMAFGMACRLTIEAFHNPPEPARSTRA
jgi:hypothetical protein